MRTVLIWAVTAFVSISAQQVSTNGRCGSGFGNRVCRGSSYGDCCSQYGWCGSTLGHCGLGCLLNFGTCFGSGISSTLRTSTIPATRSSSIASSSTRTSSTAVASPSVQISKNARCGYSNGATGGFTCKGSAYGDCCSQYSYCGSTSGYCGTGCQPGFGTCSGISSSVRSSSTSSARSSSTSSVRSSSASSSAQSSPSSSSSIPVSSSVQVSSSVSSSIQVSSSVPSSTRVSSSVSTQGTPSTSSSIAASSISSSTAASSTSSSTAASSTSSSTTASSTSSSIAASSTSSSIATSSSVVVSSSSVTPTISASSTSVLGSTTSSLASESLSPSSSVATTVSSQTSSDTISTSVAGTTTSTVSTQPSSTPPVISNQILMNPSFELGTGSDPTAWTIDRLYVIDNDASGRFQTNPHTGSYSIRGRGVSNAGYEVHLSQHVNLLPGSMYSIEVFAKQTTFGFCSIGIYLNDRPLVEFAPPGTSYTSITTVVDVSAGDPNLQTLLIAGACSLPNTANTEMYDLFIDDATMTRIVSLN